MKVKLLEPIDGYEEIAEVRTSIRGEKILSDGGVVVVQGAHNDWGVRVILKPIKQLHDFERVLGSVFVYSKGGLLSDGWTANRKDISGYYKDWQAHTDGDECPVDERCVKVQVKYWGDDHHAFEAFACDLIWRRVAQYRVLPGLAVGWDYE